MVDNMSPTGTPSRGSGSFKRSFGRLFSGGEMSAGANVCGLVLPGFTLLGLLIEGKGFLPSFFGFLPEPGPPIA